MHTTDDFNTPWSLRFERDGTEDIAVIDDANGEELLRSRDFWLPEVGDPLPATLAAMRLIVAAPALLAALDAVLPYAENECRALFESQKRDADASVEKEAAACASAIDRAHAVIEGARAIVAAGQTRCLSRCHEALDSRPDSV